MLLLRCKSLPFPAALDLNPGPAGAQKCIELMHNRFFGGRKISCEYYDNKSDYRVRESEESEEQRLKAFGDWLEGGGGGGGEN